MKFKTKTDDTSEFRELSVLDKDGDGIKVEVEKKRVFIVCSNDMGVELTRAKALKLAWAIIDELNPSVM